VTVTVDSAAELAAGLDACHDTVGAGLVGSAGGLAVASSRRLSGRPVPGCPGFTWARTPTSDDDVLAEFGLRLVFLHWDVVRTQLDRVVARLGERTSEGTTLLHRQLVQGAIADVAIALSDTVGLLDLAGSRQRLWQAHLGLVAAGRITLTLFGGESFVADGPGSAQYLAELLGNVYLHPGTGNSRG
jgi:hypothetical protein